MDFKLQLKRQLEFISRSCHSFDQGHTDEALRIALSVRVIVHDTDRSASILTHLGIKDNFFLISSSYPNTGVQFPTICGLDLRKGQPIFALLHKSPRRLLSLPEWWDEIIYTNSKKMALSRRKLILAAANKDGGAHVDKKLPDDYRSIADDGSLGYLCCGDKETPMIEAHFVTIRQIGFEILNSPDILRFLAD